MSVVEESPVGSTFYWGWKNGMTSASLNECGSYGISVVQHSGSSSLGVPPYYMVAWEVNGVPTVSPIGSDTASLSWQVNHATGSLLVLTVADSRGMTGGIDPNIYSVADGNATSSCLPSSPSASISLSANVSTSQTLQTCEPLELQVKGGQKPYTITIAALNSMLVANITLGESDDVLTWPNQATPNSQLIASVSDANGIWGTSTGIFNTAGANNTACSISSTSRSSSNSDQSGTSSPAPHASESSSTNQSTSQQSGSNSPMVLIVAIVVPIAVVGLLIGLAFFCVRRRRRRRRDEPQPAIVPDAWLGPSALLSINRDSGVSAKTYQRVARSDEAVIEPKNVVQHEDAADMRELPPPYRDRSTAELSTSLDTQ